MNREDKIELSFLDFNEMFRSLKFVKQGLELARKKELTITELFTIESSLDGKIMNALDRAINVLKSKDH